MSTLLERVAARRGKDTRTGPPDFVGVGTMQSGSKWWLDLLLQHPCFEPRRPSERELNFFGEFCTREMSDADVASYHSRFPRRPGRIAGEWTPRYSFDAWTPILLRRAAPEAKLLLLVSDPIERYRTSLARKLSEARSEKELMYLADAAGRGRYASQLRTLLAFFDQEKILVLQYEQCRAEPLRQYARTLRFLGVPDDFRPKRLRVLGPQESAGPYRRARGFLGRVKRSGLRRSVAKVPKPDLWADLMLSLLVDLEPEVLELRSLVPDLDLAQWPNFGHLATPEPTGASRRGRGSSLPVLAANAGIVAPGNAHLAHKRPQQRLGERISGGFECGS